MESTFDLYLVAVTNKAQELEMCIHVQEETVNTSTNSVWNIFISEIDSGSGACFGDYIWQKGWNLNFYQFIHRKGSLSYVSSTYDSS